MPRQTEIIYVAKSGEGGSVQDGGNQIFRELETEGGYRRYTEASRFSEPGTPFFPRSGRSRRKITCTVRSGKGNVALSELENSLDQSGIARVK